MPAAASSPAGVNRLAMRSRWPLQRGSSVPQPIASAAHHPARRCLRGLARCVTGESIRDMKRLTQLTLMVVLMATVLAGQPRKRVLVYTRQTVSPASSYIHDNTAASVEAIRKMGAENGFVVDASEDPSVFTPDNLKRYAALMFSSTHNELPYRRAAQSLPTLHRSRRRFRRPARRHHHRARVALLRRHHRRQVCAAPGAAEVPSMVVMPITWPPATCLPLRVGR